MSDTDKDIRELSAVMGEISGELEANTKAIKDVRSWESRAARGALIALIVAVLAFAGVGWAFWQLNADRVQSCERSNQIRRESVQLWDFIVVVSKPPPHETPAERRQREALTQRFVDKVHEVYKTTSCTGLVG